MSSIMKEVIEIVETEIKKKFKTKTAFCKKIKQKPQWLNGKLKEHSKITLDDLKIIADGLGVPMSSLFPDPRRIDPHTMTVIDMIRKISKAEIDQYIERERER